MAKDKKGWLSIPFAGSSTKTKPDTSAGQHAQHNGQNGKQNGAQWELRQKTAAEVSQMKEEDVIADYNSPIHMCTS